MRSYKELKETNKTCLAFELKMLNSLEEAYFVLDKQVDKEKADYYLGLIEEAYLDLDSEAGIGSDEIALAVVLLEPYSFVRGFKNSDYIDFAMEIGSNYDDLDEDAIAFIENIVL